MRIRYQNYFSLTGIKSLIHHFEANIRETNWVPCKIFVFISCINIKPNDIIREIIEVEAEVNVANLISRKIAPPRLMIAKRKIRRKRGLTSHSLPFS